LNLARGTAVTSDRPCKESSNRKVALDVAALAPEPLVLEIVEISRLPPHNEDYDAAPEYAPFRRRIKRADAVSFVTPEGDRSMPAAGAW
jgi:chromate reductase